MFPTLPDRTDCFCGSGSRIGVHITLYKPPSPVICHSFHTSKMTGTHQEQLIDHLRVSLVFIEFNFLLYMICSRHRRPKKQELSTCPASITITPNPSTQEKEATESMGPALDTGERGERLQGYRNFTRMEPAFFYLIEEIITPHLRKWITNFRKPLEVGLKLAVTLRHLSTRESYTSLEYQWRVGRTTICKFVPKVCKAILKEFQQEYLVCPTDPEDWKKIEDLETDGMSPMQSVH